MPDHAEPAARVAQRVKAAFEAADLSAFGELLDPGVQWGAPGAPSPVCTDREQVLAWYRRGREAGIRARVCEVTVHGDRVLVGLRLTGRRAAGDPRAGAERWQVLTVRGGRVTGITGFGDRGEAAAHARQNPAEQRRPGPPRWAPPRRGLADGVVALRLPGPWDAEVLRDYAARPGGLDGGWLPLSGGAGLEACRALVADWLAGWQNRPSFQGPALVVAAAAGPGRGRLAGLVGLADRGDGLVELDYGVAPDRRRRGYASRAARLAGRWLLEDGLAAEVELRIDRHNIASQRAAAAAGFAPAGTVVSRVSATGQSYEDLRFVLRPV
jgi:RimJ/RimL family protein N-acetyltransferase/ketosteroid isomerase-like protein